MGTHLMQPVLNCRDDLVGEVITSWPKQAGFEEKRSPFLSIHVFTKAPSTSQKTSRIFLHDVGRCTSSFIKGRKGRVFVV